MATISKRKGYTFDDVVLQPQFSEVKSRTHVDISSFLSLEGYIPLNIPIISANMSTITEQKMAIAMWEAGGLGILHRYSNQYEIKKWIYAIRTKGCVAIPSVGINIKEDLDKALSFLDCGASGICVDIAYANNKYALDFIEKLSNLMLKLHKHGILIAGNVCTHDGVMRLVNAGAHTVKVGVGNGSNCTTRVVTGHGVPQVNALMEANLYRTHSGLDFSIISDGGVKNSGDIVKALALGADAVMTGSLLAGTEETPGETIDGYKTYSGMASTQAQLAFRGSVNNSTPEGIARKVKTKGCVKYVMEQLAGGIRSGLSYSGANNISQLQNKAEFIIVTQNGYTEGLPHGLLNKEY